MLLCRPPFDHTLQEDKGPSDTLTSQAPSLASGPHVTGAQEITWEWVKWDFQLAVLSPSHTYPPGPRLCLRPLPRTPMRPSPDLTHVPPDESSGQRDGALGKRDPVTAQPPRPTARSS